jgi:hypothetical protein
MGVVFLPRHTDTIDKGEVKDEEKSVSHDRRCYRNVDGIGRFRFRARRAWLA